MYVVVVPGLLGYLGYATDVSLSPRATPSSTGPWNAPEYLRICANTSISQGKYDFRNKRKGDTIVEW
jgi:hypothetical protein